MKPETFYIVWSPSGSPPTVRHQTEASARMEAVRLATINPGRSFFVMALVGIARHSEATYELSPLGEKGAC